MNRSEADPGSSPETRLEASSNGASLQQKVGAVDRTGAWLGGVLSTLSILREWFPAAFAGRPRPLKVGVRKDIIERAPAITPTEIARALRYHTQSNGYLRSVRPGATRIDLDGNEVGAVTADEAAHAKDTFQERKAKAKPPAATIASAPTRVDVPADAPTKDPLCAQRLSPPAKSPVSETSVRTEVVAASEPPKTKQQRDLEQALKDRERYRQARGLGRRV